MRYAILCSLSLLLLRPGPTSASGLPDGLDTLEDEGMQYVTVPAAARYYQLDRARRGPLALVPRQLQELLAGDAKAQPVLLSAPKARWLFFPDSRKAMLNDRAVWLHEPFRKVRGRWALAAVDVRTVLDPVLRSEEHLADRAAARVVLDPGHGGKDEGARSAAGLLEKDVTLDIARRARVLLAHRGLTVYMTRQNDRTLSLPQRAARAAGDEADLFVSIHANRAANQDARGVESYVLAAPGHASTSGATGKPMEKAAHAGNDHDAANMVLGYAVHAGLLKRVAAEDRGLRRARFVVLREAPCPAVLVECGFLSHPEEGVLLGTEAYREEVARGLAEGIMDYVTLARQAELKELLEGDD